MRKIILSILGLVIIALAIFLAKIIVDSKKSYRPQAQKVVKTVFTQVVKNGTVPIVVPANGNLVAKNRVELYSEVQGVFRGGNKLFRPGQTYPRGGTIIKIDSDEYAASVRSAKSNLFNLITSVMPDLRLDYPEAFSKWQAYLNDFDMSKNTPPLPEMDSDKEKIFYFRSWDTYVVLQYQKPGTAFVQISYSSSF